MKKGKGFVPGLHAENYEKSNQYRPFRAHNSRFDLDLVLESQNPFSYPSIIGKEKSAGGRGNDHSDHGIASNSITEEVKPHYR